MYFNTPHKNNNFGNNFGIIEPKCENGVKFQLCKCLPKKTDDSFPIPKSLLELSSLAFQIVFIPIMYQMFYVFPIKYQIYHC